MLDLRIIAAIDDKRLLGVGCGLPWPHNRADMLHFSKYTRKSWLIMTRSTYNSIPDRTMPHRKVIVIYCSDEGVFDYTHDNAHFVNCSKGNCPISEAMETIRKLPHWSDRVVVCGGPFLYKWAFNHPRTNSISITHIKGDYSDAEGVKYYLPGVPDTFSPASVEVIDKGVTVVNYSRCEGESERRPDATYLDVMSAVATTLKRPRATRNASCSSVFGRRMEFDISVGFPLLTTKRVPFKSCIEELLWFIRGDTDSKILERRGVNIWKLNTTREFLDSRGLVHLPEGECGPNYSHQWRNFGGQWPSKEGGVDQVSAVLESLRKDPFSRRHIVSAWNPTDLDATALPPCHIMYQFYVQEGDDGMNELSCQLYQRSADVFLGLPWNIASYALLTNIMAMKLGMRPAKLIIVTGDTHIYCSHLGACLEQLRRRAHAYASPVVVLNEAIKDLPFDKITADHFQLVGYFSHPTISAPMVA